MKTLNIYILIILCVYSISCIAQTFPYKNYQPTWSYVVVDSSYDGYIEVSHKGMIDTFNGIRHLLNLNKPVIYGDKVINVFHNLKNANQGGFLEVRNAADGSLSWTYSFDLRTGNQREVPGIIQIDNGGNLELYTYRSRQGNNFDLFWTSANLTYRKFDLNNGRLLEHKYKEPENEPIAIASPFPIRIGQLNVNKKNVDWVVMKNIDSTNSTLVVFRFDKELNYVDTIFSIFKRNYLYSDNSSNLYQHDGFTYIPKYSSSERAALITPNIPANYELHMDKYDDEWNLIEHTSLHEALDSAGAYHYLGIKDEQHVFAVINNFNSINPERIKITTLDFDYNITETVELPVRKYRSYQVHKIPGEKGILFVASLETQNVIEIHKSDGNGNLRFIKELEADRFEDLIINVQSEIVLDRYLFTTMWVRVIKPDGFADETHDRVVVSMHDLVELGVLSGVNDVAQSHTLVLYPNPMTQAVNIANLDAPATVTISNINGQVLKQLSHIEREVNVSDLPAGVYIFDISNKTVRERHKVVKK